MFKFALKKDRLNFTSGWATSEQDMVPTNTARHDILGQLFNGTGEDAMDALLKVFNKVDLGMNVANANKGAEDADDA